MIKFGNVKIIKVLLGGNIEISKIYLGNNLVYQKQ